MSHLVDGIARKRFTVSVNPVSVIIEEYDIEWEHYFAKEKLTEQETEVLFKLLFRAFFPSVPVPNHRVKQP